MSQDRSRSILEYARRLKQVRALKESDRKILKLTTANGLSSNQLICDIDGAENRTKSRRVEFKLQTRSCRESGRYEIKRNLCQE